MRHRPEPLADPVVQNRPLPDVTWIVSSSVGTDAVFDWATLVTKVPSVPRSSA